VFRRNLSWLFCFISLERKSRVLSFKKKEIGKCTRSLTILVHSLCYYFLSFPVAQQPKPDLGRRFWRFLDHAQTHHSQYGSSGRVISPSQRPLPDNTQTQETYPCPPPHPVGFEPTISASARRKAHTLDRAAAGIGSVVTPFSSCLLTSDPLLALTTVKQIIASKRVIKLWFRCILPVFVQN
jgi:hypothetical protein